MENSTSQHRQPKYAKGGLLVFMCAIQNIYYQLYGLYHEHEFVLEYSGLEADPALPRAESQPGPGGSSAASHSLLALEECRWDYTPTSMEDVKEKPAHKSMQTRSSVH